MRVSTMTVYRLIKSGELPAIRVGKHLRIRERDVAKFLDERIVGTITEGGSDQWPAV
jgi:excisionase family DNA binding protein